MQATAEEEETPLHLLVGCEALAYRTLYRIDTNPIEETELPHKLEPNKMLNFIKGVGRGTLNAAICAEALQGSITMVKVELPQVILSYLIRCFIFIFLFFEYKLCLSLPTCSVVLSPYRSTKYTKSKLSYYNLNLHIVNI